ncbi:TetR/AcrR family transcriptional regulator [Plantibacter sp. YIM 135249]|uniref:TetR/AcrR family transcriptional regulator n=1 Tax=Plantibacter sp. YIM 135249 TaxID=3423918 RepID=UPI003D329A2F
MSVSQPAGRAAEASTSGATARTGTAVNETRTRLIEEATRLVRRRGYADVSYADLERIVGIRKASIHHHFPAKVDLGVAIIQVYSAGFLSRLRSVGVRRAGIVGQLRFYTELYREGLVDGEACLCGTLAAEVVPSAMATRVAEFFAANLDWLTQRITDGIASGELLDALDARAAAQAVLGAVQGALVVSRSLDDPAVYDGAVDAVITRLVREAVDV